MIPTYEAAMPAVLQVLADGVARHRKVVADGVAEYFQLSQEERERQYPTQRGTLLRGRTGWALTYLKQAGLVTTSKRAWYQITDRGREALTVSGATIDRRFLERYAEFREFMDRSRSSGTTAAPDVPMGESSTPGLAPDEALEQAYQTLRAEIEQDLLETVKAASPEFFERLVVDLLVRMGYGGNREDAARAVGRSGDGGIDGVIDEDRLGLDVIYLQAKRWEGGVGRPEIQKFVGALQGQRARKGIFLTTSHFTKDAEDYVTRIDSRIILVDGRRLASLMFDYEVGVTPRSTYTVKSIDGDYFDEN
jgi:restriction system protein